MARQYEEKRKEKGDGFEHLMAAVMAVVETIPVQKRDKQGWCDLNFAGLNDAVDARNRAAKEYAKTKTEEARLMLKSERDALKKLKKRAKNEWMLAQLRTCNESVLPGKGDRKNPYALWKLASKLQRGLDKWKSWDDTNVKDANGELASTPEQNATVFQTFFNSLFRNDMVSADADGEYVKMTAVEVDRHWSPPQMWEMMEELKKMKKTAAGVSGIPSTVWQACGENEVLRQGMLEVLQECWVKEKVPDEWAVFHMTVLHKKGPKDDVGNYRGISMAETLSKLYTSILKRRLEGYYEMVVPEFCNGFRVGRGRNDSMFTLKETLRKRKAKGSDSYCIFYDFIKCFDEISRDCIWKSMEVMGVSDKMIRAVKATLEGTSCKMNIGGIEKVVDMKEGTGQGTTLGPTLCNFFFLPLLIQFEKLMETRRTTARGEDEEEFSTFTHNFADDTCMVVGSLDDAKKVALEFNLYVKKFRSRVHVATAAVPKSKSVAVYVPAKTGEIAATDRLYVNRDNTEWIDFADKSAYLGSQINSDLNDDEEISKRVTKGLQMFGMLRRHLLGSKDVWNAVKKQVVLGMLLPIMLDGAEAWVVSAKALRELQSGYNFIVRGCLRFSLYTTRKYRITKECLQIKLGVESLEYYLDWRILGYAGHVARMEDHRLPKKIMMGNVSGKARAGAPPKSHMVQRRQCLKRKGIEEVSWMELALDKNNWRELIKKVGPHIGTKTSPRFKEDWELKPEVALGRCVEKQFKSKFFTGQVIGTEIDVDTNEVIWEVLYDDGDKEDFNARQLKRVLCAAGDTEIYNTRGLVATSDPLHHHPAIAVGKTVTKMYGGALYIGVVTGFDTEENTGDLIWRVKYTDGDEADYNLAELHCILLET